VTCSEPIKQPLQLPGRRHAPWVSQARTARTAAGQEVLAGSASSCRHAHPAHPMGLVVAIVLTGLLTLAVAFQAGQAYAEGPPGFLQQLNEMRNHFLAGWIWTPHR
jgi:hypothetical protein